MSLSAKSFPLVVTSTIAVLLLDHIPPAEGLKCYECKFRDSWYWNADSVDCMESKIKEIECYGWSDFCYVDREKGRGCRDTTWARGWPYNSCTDERCTCDTDLCNGPELRPKRRKTGLSCSICRGSVDVPPAARGRWTNVGDYYKKLEDADSCTSFTERGQDEEKYRAKCPDDWEKPYCYVHKKYGGGCEGENSTAFFLDDLPAFVGQCDHVGCKCDDADFCNGPLLRGERPRGENYMETTPQVARSNGVKGSARFGVLVAFVGVSFVVVRGRRYFADV